MKPIIKVRAFFESIAIIIAAFAGFVVFLEFSAWIAPRLLGD